MNLEEYRLKQSRFMRFIMQQSPLWIKRLIQSFDPTVDQTLETFFSGKNILIKYLISRKYYSAKDYSNIFAEYSVPLEKKTGYYTNCLPIDAQFSYQLS